jgi:hypothetical protein
MDGPEGVGVRTDGELGDVESEFYSIALPIHFLLY